MQKILKARKQIIMSVKNKNAKIKQYAEE